MEVITVAPPASESPSTESSTSLPVIPPSSTEPTSVPVVPPTASTITSEPVVANEKPKKDMRLYLKRMNTVASTNPHAFQEFSSDALDSARRKNNTTNNEDKSERKSREQIDTINRQIPSVAHPITVPLTTTTLFKEVDGKPDYKKLKDHLLKEGKIERDAIFMLVEQAMAIFKEEPNVLELSAPYTVCGDIHGQYYDLTNLLDNAGDPSTTPYLFLGDYVDRGYFSCEVTFLLLSMKVNFPKTFHLLRGNHESRAMTKTHNFKVECLKKYGQEVYDKIMDCFDCLPLAAVVRCSLLGRFFCVHGGLSPSIKSLDDIHSINRFAEPPVEGSMCDLLWSDPLLEDEEMTAMDVLEFRDIEFIDNVERGIGHFFGFKAVTDFLLKNNLVSMIRAHEVQQEGCTEHMFTRTDIAIPMAFTVFSAPNYCDIYSNKAAFIKLLHNKYEIYQLESVPHPYWLPDFQNVFSFSIEYVLDAVHNIMKGIATSHDDGEETKEEDWQKEAKSGYVSKLSALQQKIRAQRVDVSNIPDFDKLSPAQKFKKVAEMDTKLERCSPVVTRKKNAAMKNRQFKRNNSAVW